jgi:Mg2+/citrate symporter
MKRLLHRVISVLMWTCFLTLGAFGVYFSFANYPAFSIVVTLLIAVLLGYAERNRRQRRSEAERARSQRRAQTRDPWLEMSAQEVNEPHRDNHGERASTAVKEA